MAIYRQLHTTFWKDDFIGECSQIEKLFFLYLLSNDKTTQCGAYKFSFRYASFELGIDKEKTNDLLQFFCKNGRIRFNEKNNEVLIVNWLNYNNARSPKVAPVIDKELKNLKTIEFKSEVVTNCLELGYPIKTTLAELVTVSIPYESSPDTVSQPTKNQHKNQHKNQQQQESIVSAANLKTPFDFYQENFGVIAPTVMETVAHWISDLGEELVVEAMRRAVLDQKGFRYAEGIMRQWDNKKMKSLADVQSDDVRFNNQRKSNFGRQSKAKETLPNWANQENGTPSETPLSTQEQEEFRQQLADLRNQKQQISEVENE